MLRLNCRIFVEILNCSFNRHEITFRLVGGELTIPRLAPVPPPTRNYPFVTLIGMGALTPRLNLWAS